MSELEPTGQPAPVATPPETPPVAPATPPAPTESAPTPVPAPAGPTLEQLNEELAEARQLISQSNERAKRAEYEATYTRNLIEQGFGKGKQEPTHEVTLPTDDEFLTNPAKATAKIIENYRIQDKAERDQRDRMQYIERAKSSFEAGKKVATEKVGKLTQGIEGEIANEIQQGIISGAINPEAATDPDLWAVTALAYRYKVRGERHFDRYLGATHQGMTATHTETPTATAPPKAEMNLTPEQEELISRGNITREAFMEARAKIRSITEEKNR